MNQNIYFIGDIHGDFRNVRNFAQRNPDIAEDMYINNYENILICLGDFGGNYFENYRDDNFKSKLEKYPFSIYFIIRGNHEKRPSDCAKENPDKWHIETFFGNEVYVENEHPRFKYALDIPAVYKIPYQEKLLNVLIIPGAYSIDKMHRIENGWNWFSNEQLDEEERQIGFDLCKKYNYNFDIILSHTCPVYFEPVDLFLPFVDQSTVDKTMEIYLNQLALNIHYDFWLWGHYHADRIYPTNQHIMLFKGSIKLQDLMNKNLIIL